MSVLVQLNPTRTNIRLSNCWKPIFPIPASVLSLPGLCGTHQEPSTPPGQCPSSSQRGAGPEMGWGDTSLLVLGKHHSSTPGMQLWSLGGVCGAGIPVMSTVSSPGEAELSELPEASVITQARSGCIHLEYELRTTH